MADIEIEEVYEELKDYTLGFINVAVPGVVTSYDHTKQRATVQPVVRYREQDAYGNVTSELPLPVPGVPVAFPQGGGFSDTWPIEAGDTVLLVICDRSIDEWEATGSSDTDPNIPRRFDYSDAVAIPGVRSFADPLTAIDENARVMAGTQFLIGSETATKALTTAEKVKTQLNTLENAFNSFLTAFDTHTHIGNMAVPTGPPPASAPPVIGSTFAVTPTTSLQLELPLIKVDD